MSTTTVAAPYTSVLLPSCDKHQGNSCIEITLNAEPDGDQLFFTFVTFRRANEPAQIAVIDDLFLGCKVFRAPSGYAKVNNKTVHFHYDEGTHVSILGEARDRLKERLNARINASNAAHRRDPQTCLVHPR